MRLLRCLLILLIVLLLPTGPFATTFPVTKTFDTNDSTCDLDCSLREAIEAANTNPGADDVPVPAGFYLLTLGQLVVSDDVEIAGAGQASTQIDGNASDRVIEIQSGVVAEISSVALQNGSGVSFGGGISNEGDLTLTSSTVSGNTSDFSGAGIFSSGALTLSNSTVSGNYTFYPGAYGSGGGVHNEGDLTLSNSTVSGNYASRGGGISNHGGTATLTSSTVSGNNAFLGGGIDNLDTATLTNTTVSGNFAEFGGGISNEGDLTLTNSTVSGNPSSRGSGGIESRLYGTAHLANSVVADNGMPNCDSPVDSLGYNLADDTSCGLSATGDLVVADAMLGPLQDNGGPTETHDLLVGSPAIDAGSASCPPPATDQRGMARPQGADCDIGSVEYLPEPHRAATLIAGAALLALLYRRRTRDLPLR